jgi:hypothetical protein
MTLFNVERIDTHGGSIRGYVCNRALTPVSTKKSYNVSTLMYLEDERGFRRGDLNFSMSHNPLQEMQEKIHNLKRELNALLQNFKSQGKKIAAFGAPAKATTLMYEFDINSDIIDVVIDDSPLKQGLYTPGKHIPVVSSSYLYEQKPDVVVILAWNFADSIMKNHIEFMNRGGQFIVPIPRLQVWPAETETH